MPKLPKTLYARMDDEGILLADATMGECIDGVDTGEIAEIGEYHLVGLAKRYRKIIDAREVV